MIKPLLFTGLLALAASPAAHAELRVFACEPEWGALVQELVGDSRPHRDWLKRESSRLHAFGRA